MSGPPTLDYGIATLGAAAIGFMGVIYQNLSKGHDENRRAHEDVRRAIDKNTDAIKTVVEDVTAVKDTVFDVNDKLDTHIHTSQEWDQRNEARMARNARRRAFFDRYF